MWVVGWVTLALIGIFVNKPDRKEEATRKRPPLDRDQIALTKYMRQAKARGMSNDDISDCLVAAGWGIDAIRVAFEIVSIFL